MSRGTDNRMAWIRNIESLSPAGGRTYSTEFEFASDVEIGGVLDHAEGAILCGRLSMERNRIGLYLYTLRLTFPFPNRASNRPLATKKGYTFRDGPAAELLTLFSLYLNCRFYLTAATHGQLTPNSIAIRNEYPFVYHPCPPALDPVLFSSRQRNFAVDLRVFLDRVRSLPTEHHQRFMLACYHFSRALREVGGDTEMVFIRLVSAVEALSGCVKLHKKDDLFAGAKFQDLIRDEDLAPDASAELQRIFEIRKANARFKRFVLDNCGGFFKGGNFKARHCRITKEELPKLLSSIYDARSAYLHDGEPMYLSSIKLHGTKWDTDPSTGMEVDQRRYTGDQKMPYPYFFHGLVRHCLLQFLSRAEGG